MPRHLRVQFPGAIYHVTARGNGRQAIFRDARTAPTLPVARAEDVAFRRELGHVSSERVVTAVCEAFWQVEADLRRRRRRCEARAVAAKMLCKYGGLTRRVC